MGMVSGLDEHERGALYDRGDLGAMADQGRNELQRVLGQWTSRGVACQGVAERLAALIVGADAAELPAANGIERLAEFLRGPALACRSQGDRADCQRGACNGTA